MEHKHEFSGLEISESGEEALNKIMIDMGNGVFSAYDLIFGMKNALDEYKHRLVQTMERDKFEAEEIKHTAETLREVRLELAETHTFYHDIAVDIAAGLASAGNSDCKTKNEAILHAVARLLALHNNYRKVRRPDESQF